VSTPVTWEELDKAARERNRDALYFEAEEVIRRVREEGDLWRPVAEMEQELPAAARSRV
jgi:DNA primase